MPVGYHFVIRNEGYVEALGVMPLDDDAEALSFGAGIISDLMEDAATAEISRAQVWQWIHYGIALEGGTVATPELLNRLISEEMQRVRQEVGAEAYDGGRFKEAIQLFRDLSLAADFEDFLTVPAMGLLRPY